MTGPAALLDVLRRTRNLLLDFDGPVCSIFGGYPAPTIAARLRDLLRSQRATVTREMEASDDPLRVLRLVAAGGDDQLTRTVAASLRDHELSAIASAEPTEHLDDVIRLALDSGRRLAIVSNNSREAVTAYLERRRLLPSFAAVIGRYEGMDMTRLKPSGHLVDLALRAIDAPPWSTTLVGDATADIEAARSVPIESIGYANRQPKRQALADAGADAIIDSMAELADALGAAPIDS